MNYSNTKNKNNRNLVFKKLFLLLVVYIYIKENSRKYEDCVTEEKNKTTFSLQRIFPKQKFKKK